MGETFGKYELIKKIARGGMAEVFLAREIGGDEKTVAIKRLFPHLTEDVETVDMFLDEGRIAAKLSHENIVGIDEVGVVDDFLYIAMEYVHGRDLRSILEEGYNQDNFIPIELAASLGAQVAAGLHYAHTQTDEGGEPLGIVHRDVSPHNILVSVVGEVKICDFGIAKAEHRLTQTKAGQVKGKFSYMAPEQIETSHVDPRSDVFALGIVLYETTTMTRLFRADSQYEALEKILYAGIEPPTALRAGYPAELEKIVMKALERDADKRYQSASEMQEELDNWLVQNQASTSAVPLARYVRGLFPELATPVEQVIEESTGPMQVDADVVAAVDAKMGDDVDVPDDLDKTVVQEFDRDAAMEAAEEASREIEEEQASAAAELAAKQNARAKAAAEKDGEEVQKKDVTEMDEQDLDKALDFALGAPSEADVVLQRAGSEETQDDEPAPSAAEPAVDYGGEDATMISQRVEELAGEDAGTADTVADRAALQPEDPGSKIVPTVTREPAVPAAADPAPEPEAPAEPQLGAERSGPPGAPPPATRSGSVPTAPPGASKPPPAATSAESRAKAAFEPDEPAHSDISLDDLGDASQLSSKKTGIVVFALFVLGVIIFGLMYAAGLDTEGSEMEKEADRTTIDPDMLVVEVADPRERVMAAVETTPAEAAIVVNGQIVERSGGQIPLVEGEKNEVNVYAPGHKPARAFVDGDGSGSPISFTLEPAEEVPEEERADLDVITEPRGATIYVDGQEVGKSPTTVTGLWTGVDHHVYAELEGRFAYAGFIGLVKKSKNEVQVTLDKLDSGKKNYVEVVNAAIPRGTSVVWNGEPIGATPGFKNFDRNTYATVELEEKDSVPMRRYLVLEDVGTFELRPFLEPMKREKGTITVFVEPMGPEIYVGANAYGQGPAGNVVLPEGPVKVVLDTPHGRKEVAVEVVANTHTRYTLKHDKAGVDVIKKK